MSSLTCMMQSTNAKTVTELKQVQVSMSYYLVWDVDGRKQL